MNNLKTQPARAAEVAEPITDNSSRAFAADSTPPKALRGRPPGRPRKENLSESNQPGNFNPEVGSAVDSLSAPRQVIERLGRAGRNRQASSRANSDKPIFTLSVAAEILHLHPRTLRIYEEHDLVVPTRTQTNRRRYSQNDIKKFQFIQYLTRERGVNLSGVKIILELLEEIRKTIADPVRHIFPDYGESEGFPLL